MTSLKQRPILLLVVSVVFVSQLDTAQAQDHLASARAGAKVIEVSSNLDRQSRADNLLDGDPATTWATARGKLKDQYVIIRLAVKKPTQIGAVAIDNSPAEGHPREAAVRRFRLEVSATGSQEGDFTLLKSGSCRLGGGRQVFTFRPAKARYVRLTLQDNYGHPDWIEVAEIEVYAAGAPPLQRGEMEVLLLSDASDAAHTQYARLVESLAKVGVSSKTFPGTGSSRNLSLETITGFRAVLVSSDPAPGNGDVRTLLRYAARGGGIVCAIPPDPSPLSPLLEAFGASATAAEPAGEAAQLLKHWITADLAAPSVAAPSVTVELPGAEPLAVLPDGRAIAVAGPAGAGRLVLMPAEVLSCQGGQDSCEMARRAVLWAAAMEDTGTPPGPTPVQLAGQAVFLNASSSESDHGFANLRRVLTSHGLTIVDYKGDPEEFGRSAIGEAKLLIAHMPAFDELVSLDIADWVAGGGALLVLGDASAQVTDLIAVNRFLREFGMAMTLSPAANLSVEVCEHPATANVRSLSRPGEPLGVWSLQGVPLARMAGTPVAMARTFGKGRVIGMDAGFVVDPVEPSPQRPKAEAAHGIHLEENEEFGLRCVAWLLGGE